MSTDQILSLLISERDKLNRAIEALRGGGKPAPAKSSSGASVATSATVAQKRKPRTPAQKKAQSERMKKFWAERRKKLAK